MSTAVPRRRPRVLLVEDDPGDVLMIREAYADLGRSEDLMVVNDGIEALEHVRHEGAYAEAPLPDLILLDLNLPRMSGREVLHALKTDPALSHIPVVVLTTSSGEEDIVNAYTGHASSYVTKPVDFEEFVAAIHQIDRFYSEVARLPDHAA
ncbi:response regulator [Cellulomonas sp. NS3]|uniref:response regulator n=1 Tax=Cellulomonas sp. NS3 TaxID=2973977 RepID=UPI002163710E|nr:response regulator [Cellulomonas sp. NS3]